MADAALQEGAPDRCANAACPVAEDGRCMEGFADKTECPQYGRVQVIPIVAAPGVYPAPRNGVSLPLSTALTVVDADDQVKARNSHVIAIAGPHAAGKTSLIAGLYDLFQLGTVGTVAFAQSYSLHAFEEAAHDSRAASRRGEPTTVRTQRGEVRFYHLEVVDTGSGAAPTLLLGDRAGEEYLETRNNPPSALLFPELKRADVLTVLVDGSRLMDAGMRHNLRSDIRQTLQALTESGVVRPTQRLALVLTKLDVILKTSDQGQKTFEGFDNMVAGLRTDYGEYFADIKSFRVAAQPSTDGAKHGEGLDKLLAYWMEEPLRYRPGPMTFEVPPAERYFARLMPAAKDAS